MDKRIGWVIGKNVFAEKKWRGFSHVGPVVLLGLTLALAGCGGDSGGGSGDGSGNN